MTDFLGAALAFPIRPNGRGGLAVVRDVEAVEDSIRAIIETLKGSHRFNPFLGLPSFAFKPIANVLVVGEFIKTAIWAGDDRVDPESLTVDVSISDDGLMTVDITYRIIGEATERTLQHSYRTL